MTYNVSGAPLSLDFFVPLANILPLIGLGHACSCSRGIHRSLFVGIAFEQASQRAILPLR